MINGIFIVDYQTHLGMMNLMTKLKEMKDRALELLGEIEESVCTCCAITMEPEDVLEKLEQLREEINKI